MVRRLARNFPSLRHQSATRTRFEHDEIPGARKELVLKLLVVPPATSFCLCATRGCLEAQQMLVDHLVT